MLVGKALSKSAFKNVFPRHRLLMVEGYDRQSMVGTSGLSRQFIEN